MGKTVEQIYQKKSQHEHILTRPDMYIGTIEPITEDIWVYDEVDNIMKQRKCTWIPGLYKIFDEILVNAADNKVRDPEGQTVIKVWVDTHSVRVYNNGEGIPIQRHKEHQLWIPEMIFGHLLTSSNYDDDEAKVTGGRNGFGAKLTNVFSTRFEVQTLHSRSRKQFRMEWCRNMLDHSEPEITPCDGPDFTMVTFYPDFAKFNIQEFTDDMLLMMKRRVFDLAGCTDKTLKCYLNGERIGISTFPEYVDLYPTMGEERVKQSYAKVNDRWEVCVRVSNIGFQQVSFVNSIATTRGGTHVKYIMDQIITKVTEQAKKKSKTEVKPHMIRPFVFLFVNCLIENPSFDSQTKETLNSVRSKFGSSCDIPSSLVDYILKSGIVERSVEAANSKLTKEIASKLRNADRKQVLGIPKLDDANEAGGKYSYRCTLILTEGDSAKTLCTAGLAVKDTDYFGVFPLRGKLLNVRDASLKKVMECEEIQNIMKILGLDMRQRYTSVEGLRYGHLMIMADQDHDGSHIKGLILNMIHHYWPDLLRADGFLQQFITPIVKARRKGRVGVDGESSGEAISFFSMPDYFKWKEAIGPGISQYQLRYYKGLGTSGAKEGREYFENIERHRLQFVSDNDEDRIAMAFAKDRVEERKTWITQFKANESVNEYMDYSVPRVTYKDFVDKELILFSVADCERSIPSIIDGFKPGQRKILFACFKRNLTKSIKVAQFAGYVAEHSAYHHGEQSLVQTIIGMAQNFIGSNNLPLLQQDGQFGTRLQGGKDHAAGRYIFTRLAALTRLLFHPADEYVVTYRDDDGLSVEPYFYMPVIPMVLVNGTSGIGTGFSTTIPSFNPLIIIDNLLRLMDDQPLEPMKPWYFGFTGDIVEKEPGKFMAHGKMNVCSDGVINITELPVGVWTQQYKKFLDDLREKELVIQYREHNTDVTVDFDVWLHPEVLQAWSAEGVLMDRLQLKEYIHTSNIIAFSREGQITKYGGAESVVREFYSIRLEYYQKRKDYLLGQLQRSCSKLENMVRFVREVVEGTLIVTKRKKKELLQDLFQRGYAGFPPQQKKNVSATTIVEEEEEGTDQLSSTERRVQAQSAALHSDDTAVLLGIGVDAGDTAEEEESLETRQRTKDYDYLLGMRLWALTAEMIARLEGQLARLQEELRVMQRRTPQEMWRDDLNVLRKKIEDIFEHRWKEILSIKRKKLEKKREFNTARLRVPLLSDRARAVLRKEMEKKIKGNNGRGGVKAEEGTSSVGDTGGAVVSTTTGRTPAARRPPASRKRKRKDSDEDEDLSLDWLYSDNEEEEDLSSASRPRTLRGVSREGATTRTSRVEEEGPSSGSSIGRGGRRAAPRRTPVAATSAGGGGGSRSSRSSTAKKNSTRKAEEVELDDLDLFGLDAVTPSLMSSSPSAASANSGAKGTGKPLLPREAPTIARTRSQSSSTLTSAFTSSSPSGGAVPSSSSGVRQTKSLLDDNDEEELELLGLKTTAPTPQRSASSTAATSLTSKKEKAPRKVIQRRTVKNRRRRSYSSEDDDDEEESISSEEEDT